MTVTVPRLSLQRFGVLVSAILYALACATYTQAQSMTFTEMESNNTFSSAQNVGTLSPLSGIRITVNASRNGDDSAEFFSFFVTAGRTFTLQTNPLPGDANAFLFDTVLGLFDPDGNLVAFNDDGATGFTSFLSFTVPDGINGFFRAAVSGYGDSGTFDDDGVQLSSMFMGGGSAGFDYGLVIEGQNAAPNVAAVPEPTTLLLLGISAAGVGAAAVTRKYQRR